MFAISAAACTARAAATSPRRSRGFAKRGKENHRVVARGVALALPRGAEQRPDLVLREVVAQAPLVAMLPPYRTGRASFFKLRAGDREVSLGRLLEEGRAVRDRLSQACNPWRRRHRLIERTRNRSSAVWRVSEPHRRPGSAPILGAKSQQSSSDSPLRFWDRVSERATT